MKKVTVYCGKTIEDKCGPQLHPITEVTNANLIVTSDKDEVCYSNNPDFVSAIKYIGEKHGVETEFFLDGVSHGNKIDPIFGSFNIALDMICELGGLNE